MPTIKEVAQAAGVSAAIISRVINNKPGVGADTREKVKKIIIDMGYYPNANAQAVNEKAKNVIGLIIPNLLNPFFASLAHGIEKVASEHKVQLVLNSSAFDKNKELAAIETMLEHRYQSIVLHSVALDDESLIKLADKIPGLVLLHRYIKPLAHRCVWLNDEMGGQLMAQHLVDQGHKQIAVISSHCCTASVNNRIASALAVLEYNQINPINSLIEINESTIEGGRAAACNLLASGQKFTAVLCFNDAMAYGAQAFMQEQGITIPTQISIIGYNNSMFSTLSSPNLTTINCPIESMAIRASELSLALIKIAERENQEVFKPQLNEFFPELIIRDTVTKLM